MLPYSFLGLQWYLPVVLGIYNEMNGDCVIKDFLLNLHNLICVVSIHGFLKGAANSQEIILIGLFLRYVERMYDICLGKVFV